MSLEREIADAERSFTEGGPGPHQEITETKRSRRRSNYRAIARRNQAVFLLTMALAVSVIFNVVLIFKGGMR